jgi:hypothetical protein
MFTEIRSLLTDTLNKIIKMTTSDQKLEDTEEVNLLYGVLELVASLIEIVQPGSDINMNLNEKECSGTVVDGSYYSGKLDISVIIDDESNVTKLAREQAKDSKLFENNDKIPWRQELLPDSSLVNQAIVE